MLAMVCGAGVGGLAAAIALERAGYEVIVFEQAEDMRVTGFGLNLWPNAGRALYSLGLRVPYEAVAVPLERYWTLSASGAVLCERRVDHWPEKYGAPATGVYRRGLSSMLADALGRTKVRYGYELTSVSQAGATVTVRFANGEMCEGALLIGADGIRSTTRACMFGAFPYRENRFYSYRWRGVIRLEDTSIDPMAETEVFGGRAFFGTVPIGDGLGYWFASGPGIDSFEAFMSCYGTWRESHVPRTIAATARDQIVETKLEDLATMPGRWTHGRIALLGDAAHPMMPDLAQGASQTFVDAQVLGECMAAGSDVEDSLREYENRRRPDAYRAVELSRRGLFRNGTADLERDEVDPIALRYERGIEKAVDV
jgi:2-polyprenyl-6-methoxyphenol hydroxylase-like FAD-dependent oxidoreductase